MPTAPENQEVVMPDDRIPLKISLPKWAVHILVSIISGGAVWIGQLSLSSRNALAQSPDVQIAVIQTQIEGINKNLSLMFGEIKEIRDSLMEKDGQ